MIYSSILLFIAVCRCREIGFTITVGSELLCCHSCWPSVWNCRYSAECVWAWSLKEQNYTVAWGTFLTSTTIFIYSHMPVKMYSVDNDIVYDLLIYW